MLMPSQSPSSTITIQTLPSDQQQQQEYIETLNSEKNSTVIKFRREKSMEFDHDSQYMSDDINNNYSAFETTNEMIKLQSRNSSPTSNTDENFAQISSSSSSSQQISSPSLAIQNEPSALLTSSTRRSNRSLSTRRLIGETDQILSTNSLEPDPNVFLISSDTNSHNTIRKTKHDVKRFVMYIDEQFGEQNPIQTLSAESLCRYLKHYFENTKKFDGTQYEPDTLRSFLLSIERYLKSKQYEYNLMESPLFQSCRQVILSKREQWRRMGGGNHLNNSHSSKSSLSLINIQNLTVFDRTKPDSLLLEIYVHISKFFQEKDSSISQLLWGDISLIDDQYLVCQQQKGENQIRLYATKNQLSTCPVQAYRLYATHRPPQCNTPQSAFFLLPRATNVHHTWYKTTAAGKNLEQILQNAISKQTSSSSSSPKLIVKSSEHTARSSSIFPESRKSSSPNQLPPAKRLHSSISSIQPLNLSIIPSNNPTEDEINPSSSSSSPSSTIISPVHSVSNDVLSQTKNSSLLTDMFQTTVSSSTNNLIWDESVTDILLLVAKQRDTRVVKINILRTYLEEKLGVVEFLCLYRGFKSEPKLTFQGTPWEHYQRFLPVLFTLLSLDNTTV